MIREIRQYQVTCDDCGGYILFRDDFSNACSDARTGGFEVGQEPPLNSRHICPTCKARREHDAQARQSAKE